MRTRKYLGWVVGCLLLMGTSSAFGEVLNGDFEVGAVQFSSEYTFSPVGTGPGQWTVGSKPSLWNSSYADPSGSNLMLIANGSTSYDKVWSQNVQLTQGTTYQISFDAASLTDADDQFADLSLYVKPNPFTSVPVATVVLDNNLGVWKTASGSYTAAVTGIVEMFIGNLNVSATGNAFAIDNIVAVPEPSSLALLGMGSLVGLAVHVRRRRKV